MNILVTAPYNEKGLQELQTTFGNATYRVWKENGRAYNAGELSKLLDDSKADALITEHDEVTAAVINSHPDLRFIGVCRGTPSNVDLQAAKDRGIPVFHTPARNAQAVAELFVGNVITLLRHTLESVKWLRNKNWGEGAHTSYLQFKGNELAHKTIGIVGFGAIGQRIAEMVQPFPCPVIYYDPFVKTHNEAYRQVSLDTVFAAADIVSVHLPVNKDTTGLIDARLIGTMKPSALFVNTARASVVNRNDLLQAIQENKIRGAILDVFDNEPPDAVDYELISHPHVLATPHIAGATHEVEDHHVTIMNKALISWAKSHAAAL